MTSSVRSRSYGETGTRSMFKACWLRATNEGFSDTLLELIDCSAADEEVPHIHGLV